MRMRVRASLGPPFWVRPVLGAPCLTQGALLWSPLSEAQGAPLCLSNFVKKKKKEDPTSSEGCLQKNLAALHMGH